MEQQLQDIESEINNLKDEVAELSKKKPWYTEVSAIVAVAALFLSIATTSVSYVKSSHQDYLSSRVELRGLISEISKIASEHAKVTTTYADKPELLAQLSSQLNTRNLVVPTKQCRSIISISYIL